jgi:hypothetical protein
MIADCRLTAEQFTTALLQSTINNRQSAMHREARLAARDRIAPLSTGDCELPVGRIHSKISGGRKCADWVFF